MSDATNTRDILERQRADDHQQLRNRLARLREELADVELDLRLNRDMSAAIGCRQLTAKLADLSNSIMHHHDQEPIVEVTFPRTRPKTGQDITRISDHA